MGLVPLAPEQDKRPKIAAERAVARWSKIGPVSLWVMSPGACCPLDEAKPPPNVDIIVINTVIAIVIMTVMTSVRLSIAHTMERKAGNIAMPNQSGAQRHWVKPARPQGARPSPSPHTHNAPPLGEETGR